MALCASTGPVLSRYGTVLVRFWHITITVCLRRYLYVLYIANTTLDCHLIIENHTSGNDRTIINKTHSVLGKISVTGGNHIPPTAHTSHRLRKKHLPPTDKYNKKNLPSTDYNQSAGVFWLNLSVGGRYFCSRWEV